MLLWGYKGPKGFDVGLDNGTAGECWLRVYSEGTWQLKISADFNDATVTDADFAEIEAFANGLVAV